MSGTVDPAPREPRASDAPGCDQPWSQEPHDPPADGTPADETPADKTPVPATTEPAADAEPAAVEPAAVEPAAVEPAAVEPVTVEPVTVEPVDWNRLPEVVRTRLAEVAAAAVGGLPVGEVPVPLRRLARFTPAKRARLGAAPIAVELSRSAAFRTSVVAWWAEHRPGELSVDADDPLTAAAAGVLTDDPRAREALTAAVRRGEVGELRAELEAALSRNDKLSLEIERLRAELAEAREHARSAGSLRETEYQQLRRTVSEQGAKLRAALDARSGSVDQVERVRAEAAAGLAAAHAERDRERERAEKLRRRAETAAAEVAAARQAAREARQADEVRLSLLLDTIGGAVGGLRRELALGGSGPRPGDLVVGAGTVRGGGSVDGPGALDALLAVPSSHLIVDGYNVSKTGYPGLTLADQRTRLVGQLTALASRTGVEVTVVWDGAGVVAAPTRGTRGVRVLFSDKGVIADDVIRSLVAAEPPGRVVLVATSDAAVVRSVRGKGAWTLPSALMLTRLTRS